MNPRIYRRSLDVIVLTRILQDTLRSDGFSVQRVGIADEQYIQIRKEGSSPGLAKSVLGGHSLVFTVRVQRSGENTTISIGETKWAEATTSSTLTFYPLVNPIPHQLYQQYRLPERVFAVIDEYFASLMAPSSQVSSAKAWELSTVQGALSNSLSKNGAVDLGELARESNNNVSIVTWMAEKMASSGDYVLTTDKTKMLSRQSMKEKIENQLNADESKATKKFCSKCGRSVLLGDLFCQSCGAKVTPG